ncbi:MAG: hypothetical protein ACRCVW_00410 [Brevinema sp.]
MGFSIFVWGISALFLIMNGLLFLVFRSFVHPFKNKHSYLGGIFFLLLILWLYLPVSSALWMEWNNALYPIILHVNTPVQAILYEVWHTIVFFGDIWPSLFIGLLVLSLKKAHNPKTYRYRMLKTFGHAKILILVFALFVYIIFNYFSLVKMIRVLALNIALYTAVFYWQFGFRIILYYAKMFKIPYGISYVLMIVIPILFGEHFMIPLFLYTGVGITDIWMDYYQRDASAMLFELDFN